MPSQRSFRSHSIELLPFSPNGARVFPYFPRFSGSGALPRCPSPSVRHAFRSPPRGTQRDYRRMKRGARIAANVVSRSEHARVAAPNIVIEKDRGIFPAKSPLSRSACCTPSADQLSSPPLLRFLLFFPPFFFLLAVPLLPSPFPFQHAALPLFCDRLSSPPLCPAVEGFTRTNRSCSPPRIRLKLNFFSPLPCPCPCPSPRGRKVKRGRGGEDCGMDGDSLRAFPFALSLFLCPRMESRSDTGGNRVEIQESASLQLGSDVTKFRVVAAEVGRHFVSSYERRDFARGYISHIAHTGRYICASLLSAFLFLLLSLVFFFFFFSSQPADFASRRVAVPTRFVARSKLKFPATILS